MRALVTGAAGFIASTLADALVASDHDVVGVDCFTPYYARAAKEANLASLRANERFRFVEGDLRDLPLPDLLADVDVVFHLAGQPGVRLSWSEGFAQYEAANVLATQVLLEAAKDVGVDRLVYASSSSVYGNQPRYPASEDDLPRPHSPYGVTKLAAEHLCTLYADNWSVPTVSLRYFSVYGPRQRPDMGLHKLIESALARTTFPQFGDGSHVRDFTFVEDVVAATIAAASVDVPPGTVLNVAGGSSAAMRDVVAMVGEAVGRPVELERLPEQAGDVQRTGGAVDRAAAALGWRPQVPLAEGIERQVAWHRARRG